MSTLWARGILNSTPEHLAATNPPLFAADRWQHACRLYLDAVEQNDRDKAAWGAVNQATLQIITAVRRAERDGRKTLRVADLVALINQHGGAP